VKQTVLAEGKVMALPALGTPYSFLCVGNVRVEIALLKFAGKKGRLVFEEDDSRPDVELAKNTSSLVGKPVIDMDRNVLGKIVAVEIHAKDGIAEFMNVVMIPKEGE